MTNTLYLPELREMLAEGDHQGLGEFCTALHPARTADYMEGLSAEESWQVLSHASPQERIEIFQYLTEEKQLEIFAAADEHEMARLLVDLPADDRVDIVQQLTPDRAEALLALVPLAERRDIQRLRAYAEGTAGAVMTSDFARVDEKLTVNEALESVRRQVAELETIYYLYVVDDDDHLRGLVTLRQLVVSRPDTLVSDLMERDIVSVDVDADQQEAAREMARYDILAIPVVDRAHHILGIITHDDVIDVVVEEATEDAHLLGGVDPLRDGYLETSFLTMSWKRGVWLLFLFTAGMFTVMTLSSYQGDMKTPELEWVMVFVPLVISSGGNSGSQSATLIITALSLGHVSLSDWWRVVRRELTMGLFLGGGLAFFGFIAALIIAHPPHLMHALILPVTLVMVVTAGTLLGSILPLVFRSLGLDPALMSTPFVAGIIDIVGILIYVNVAILVTHYF
ncbi:MAG: magnesium transporter [Pirellulales bacterium]